MAAGVYRMSDGQRVTLYPDPGEALACVRLAAAYPGRSVVAREARGTVRPAEPVAYRHRAELLERLRRSMPV